MFLHDHSDYHRCYLTSDGRRPVIVTKIRWECVYVGHVCIHCINFTNVRKISGKMLGRIFPGFPRTNSGKILGNYFPGLETISQIDTDLVDFFFTISMFFDEFRPPDSNKGIRI